MAHSPDPSQDIQELGYRDDNNRTSTYTHSTFVNPRSPPPQSAKRFHETTYMIPTPGANGTQPKRYEPLLTRLPIIIGSPISLFILGIGLEIVAGLSERWGGFKMPYQDLSTVFGTVSAQFLATFLPTFLIIPNAILWRELDWMLRSYQPYIVLQKGGAKAEESILLDYIDLGPVLAIPRALKYRHRIIFVSALTASLTYMFQPLTASVFQVRQTVQTSTWTASFTETVGLAADISSLQGFLAAAGFVDAAVIHGFPDPEFINGGWAISKFNFPTNPLLNATVIVNATTIRSLPNCSNPIALPTIANQGGRISLSSTSIDGCTKQVQFDAANGNQQYGVDAVPCPGNAGSNDVSIQPVMFWFYHVGANNQPQAKTVFCTPRLEGHFTTVQASVTSGRVLKVDPNTDTIPFNNVLNGPNEGKVFNGVVFPPQSDPATQVRANATNILIPSAIFRFMSQQEGGVDAAFASSNGVLDATEKLYKLHLSLTAKAVYFVSVPSRVEGTIVAIEPRLWVDPLPAHLLASTMIIIGIAGVFLHVANRRQRKRLTLASQPGSIASIASLTARSGWPELLTPSDNELVIEKKLEGLTFSLDKRTGTIVADDYSTLQNPSAADEVRMSLLNTQSPQSSSFFAAQAAAGYDPWGGTKSSTLKK